MHLLPLRETDNSSLKTKFGHPHWRRVIDHGPVVLGATKTQSKGLFLPGVYDRLSRTGERAGRGREDKDTEGCFVAVRTV